MRRLKVLSQGIPTVNQSRFFLPLIPERSAAIWFIAVRVILVRWSLCVKNENSGLGVAWPSGLISIESMAALRRAGSEVKPCRVRSDFESPSTMTLVPGGMFVTYFMASRFAAT